jgi:hypothetical protein
LYLRACCAQGQIPVCGLGRRSKPSVEPAEVLKCASLPASVLASAVVCHICPRRPHVGAGARRRCGGCPANGSILAAHPTIGIAVALNLVPCFTPVESPESNGTAEAFVKTFKRDYVWVGPVPNAAAALGLIEEIRMCRSTLPSRSGAGALALRLRRY